MITRRKNELNYSMNIEAKLRSEFDAEEGSFLLKIRCELEWDREKFKAATSAMYKAADEWRQRDSIPRWIAQGFWYFETFVPTWTSHPNFPRPESEYYHTSVQLIRDLSYFLFIGESLYEDDTLEKLSLG